MDSKAGTQNKIEKEENKMEEKQAQEVQKQEEELAKHKEAKKKADKKTKTTKKPKTTKKAKAKKADIYIKPAHTKGIITTAHLEEEFGIKAKVIRRYLRKMEESTKPRGAERYEWEAGSKELKAIRTNLEAIKGAMISNVK